MLQSATERMLQPAVAEPGLGALCLKHATCAAYKLSCGACKRRGPDACKAAKWLARRCAEASLFEGLSFAGGAAAPHGRTASERSDVAAQAGGAHLLPGAGGNALPLGAPCAAPAASQAALCTGRGRCGAHHLTRMFVTCTARMAARM